VVSADKDAKALVEAAQAESEATLGEPIPESVRGGRRGRSVVQSVRLPAEDFAEIERIGARAKVPVGALIRGWVLAGLAAERDMSLRDAIDHLAEEAQRLRRLAAVSDVA
jgi:predicted DNA-binding ribbon-helix-helix protein